MTRSQTRRSLLAVSNEVSFASASSILPPTIWENEWKPAPSSSGPQFCLENLSEEVYKAASRARPTATRLHLTGRTVADLAAKFEQLLNLAITEGDFSQILSSSRTVLMYVFFFYNDLTVAHSTHFSTIEEEGKEPEIVSSGEGIEREMVFLVFQRFVASSTQWFHPRADGRSTLRILHSAESARAVPSSRIINLTKLGAICALMMIMGQSPHPFDPAVFQYLVHDCDLEALHPAFIGEWHADLRKTILDWKATGYQGNVAQFESHFMTYHDYEVRLHLLTQQRLSKVLISLFFRPRRSLVVTKLSMLLLQARCCTEQ